MSKKWIAIGTIMLATILSGCAKDASGDDHKDEVVSGEVYTNRTNVASGDVIWIAIVMTWNPVNRVIDKEFSSEEACWNYYEGGIGEGKFGTQVLDHQDNPPTKDFNFGPDHLEYPIRVYKVTGGQVWLTCDIKGRYEGL